MIVYSAFIEVRIWVNLIVTWSFICNISNFFFFLLVDLNNMVLEFDSVCVKLNIGFLFLNHKSLVSFFKIVILEIPIEPVKWVMVQNSSILCSDKVFTRFDFRIFGFFSKLL